MRRPVAALVIVLAAVGVLTGGLAWLLDTPKVPRGAPRAERLYLGLCATCHGSDGRGSWRAAIIKHGGAPIGRPGMPAFGSTISDEEIEELARYIRGLAGKRRITGAARYGGE